MVIAAVEKMGKTTFGSFAPDALLVPLEVGFAGVNVPKTDMLQTYEQTVAFVDEVTYYAQRGQFPYRTLILDSATALERQIHDNIIRRDPQCQEVHYDGKCAWRLWQGVQPRERRV
jgi:hypothetical protein